MSGSQRIPLSAPRRIWRWSPPALPPPDLSRGLVGGPGRHNHLMLAVHHCLAVAGAQKVPSAGRAPDPRLRIGEVALGLVVGHPGMILARCRPTLRLRLGPGFHRHQSLLDILQPALSKGRLLWQLVTAPVPTIPAVFFLIHLLGPTQQLRHLSRQLRFLLLHTPITHRLAFRDDIGR